MSNTRRESLSEKSMSCGGRKEGVERERRVLDLEEEMRESRRTRD